MTGALSKLDTNRWESVADLARWLLTHADEYEVAVIVLADKERRRGEDPPSDVSTHCCPSSPVSHVLGMLELAKYIYIRDADAHEVAGESWPPA